MNGVEIGWGTLIVAPEVGLLVGFLFGILCYFIGRLTMSLDYRYQAKQAKRQAQRRAKVRQSRHRAA